MNYNVVYTVGDDVVKHKFSDLASALVASLEREEEISIKRQPITVEFTTMEEVIGDILRNPCSNYQVCRVFHTAHITKKEVINDNISFSGVVEWLIDSITTFSDFMYTFRRGEPGVYQLAARDPDEDWAYFTIAEKF